MFPLQCSNEYYLNPNLTITSHFDAVINELDIETETLLADLAQSTAQNTFDLASIQVKQDNINKLREKFISEIKRIEKVNLDNQILLNENPTSANQLFKEFCFFIDKNCLQLDEMKNFKEAKFDLGVLVITNEFIQPDEICDLKRILKLNLENHKSLLDKFFELNLEAEAKSVCVSFQFTYKTALYLLQCYVYF